MSIAVHLSLLISKQYSGLTFFNFQVELEQQNSAGCCKHGLAARRLHIFCLRGSAPGHHAAEADKSSTLNQIQFKLFKNYQKEIAHRLFMIREAERLVPVVDGNDVNVPRVKTVHEGPPNKALPAKYFTDKLSCIFTSEMIKKYDQLNHEFAQRMRKKSWPTDLADLILLDIQFLKRAVK